MYGKLSVITSASWVQSATQPLECWRERCKNEVWREEEKKTVSLKTKASTRLDLRDWQNATHISESAGVQSVNIVKKQQQRNTTSCGGESEDVQLLKVDDKQQTTDFEAHQMMSWLWRVFVHATTSRVCENFHVGGGRQCAVKKWIARSVDQIAIKRIQIALDFFFPFISFHFIPKTQPPSDRSAGALNHTATPRVCSTERLQFCQYCVLDANCCTFFCVREFTATDKVNECMDFGNWKLNRIWFWGLIDECEWMENVWAEHAQQLDGL